MFQAYIFSAIAGKKVNILIRILNMKIDREIIWDVEVCKVGLLCYFPTDKYA